MRSQYSSSRIVVALASALAASLACGSSFAQSLDDLRSMSLEQLSNIQVTTALKRPEPLSDTPASVYVITSDDIRRSGAISLPEVLRLAPNLEVAQQSAQTWVISARGFNATSSSNKLLVLIDGRTVYEPVESGVYWDQLQVPLDDIERIEVISGPGGTLWGANAVNGVINIIMKSSFDTLGGLLDLKGGTDQSGVLQYGAKAGPNTAYRVYGSAFDFQNTDLKSGGTANDNWIGGQGGFRTDWRRGVDELVTEGDFYRNQNYIDWRNYGDDLLARWSRTFSADSVLSLQLSYDRQVRLMQDYRDSYEDYDAQVQHTLTLGRNQLVYGGEFLATTSDLVNTANSFVLAPPSTTLTVGNIFAQDTYAITPALKLTFGTKIEKNTYTDPQFLPDVRLGWTVSDSSFLWAAISRAVRTPSRLDRQLTAPVILAPAPEFKPENLISYELGYRGRPTGDTSISVSLYYNEYNNLRTTGISDTPGYLYQLQNNEVGHTYGMEAWGDWRPVPWWRWSAGVDLLHKDLHVVPGATDVALGESEGYDPSWQFKLRTSVDLGSGVELDGGITAVSHLTNAAIPSYVLADGRIGWHVTDRLEVSLNGQNLFGKHAETVEPGDPIQIIRRSIYLGLRLSF